MPLPEPQCGLVISYSYLWRDERDAGLMEGRKDRPCAIVLVVKSRDDTQTVTVAPITHSKPKDPALCIEIPAKVKQHVGLDGQPSWIVLEEFNEFVWPGFDLRPLPNNPTRYDYGMLPPNLFLRIRDRIVELRHSGGGQSSPRD